MRPGFYLLLRQPVLGCFCLMAISCQQTPVSRSPDSQPATKLQRSSMAQPGLTKSEFIFETAPFPECHASTIAETESGLIAAWFGGTHERHPDVGIWISRTTNGRWTPPIEIANGIQSATNRYPCWNPVLFQPDSGPLLLFYKVGPSPSKWWGMLTEMPDPQSAFAGQIPKPRRLPEGILGPIKNKPVQLPNGDILSPSSTEDNGWRAHFEWTGDLGKTWHKTEPVNDGKTIGAIQPTILFHPDGKLQALGRTKQSKIFEIWSNDSGKTWGEMKLTALPNPNSGIDAVTLRDGRQLLVYNHSAKGRSPLNVAVSADGKAWQSALTLEDDPRKQFSYPAVIQTKDGLVHITYTWKRERIKHAVLDPLKLKLEPLAD
jgi:predicted neuraminidase